MSEPINTTFTEGGDSVLVLQNFWILATKQVSVALTSAGPAVHMTLLPHSASLVAKWAPCRSQVLARKIWSGNALASLGRTRLSCSKSTLRGWNGKGVYINIHDHTHTLKQINNTMLGILRGVEFSSNLKGFQFGPTEVVLGIIQPGNGIRLVLLELEHVS